MQTQCTPLIDVLNPVTDCREKQGQRYSLSAILTLATVAMMCVGFSLSCDPLSLSRRRVKGRGRRTGVLANLSGCPVQRDSRTDQCVSDR